LPPWLGSPLWNICVTNDHGYSPQSLPLRNNQVRLHALEMCLLVLALMLGRRVWRYQRGNQNPYFEEERTTQWPKEKVAI
jgi:cytochrome b561